MLRFPHTSGLLPLEFAERPRRKEDPRLKLPKCLEKLKGIGRVAVVGGGLAGLMAARRLVQSGVKVTVYEARKEVGGRVLSNSTFSNGRIIEEGAELIGSFHTKWLELAHEFGLAMISRMDPDLYERACLDVQLILQKRLSKGEFKDLTRQMYSRVLTPLALKAAAEIQHEDRPWLQNELQKYDNMSVQEALPKFCQISERGKNPADEPLWQMLEFKLVNDEVAPLDEMNFLGLLCKVRGGQGERCSPDLPRLTDGYWDELEIFRCAEGCQTLATKLAAMIQTRKYGPEPARVRRLVAVTQISISKTGVTLGLKATRADGKFVDDKPPLSVPGFSYVILAIPPSVWPRVKITADGDDANPAKTIKMRMNDAVKHFSEVKERFWIQKKAAPYGGALRLGQVWEGTDNQTRVGKQGIVLSVFAGPVSASRKAPTRDEILKELSRLYPDYAGNLTKPPLFSDWPNVPFIKTGYWTPAPGEIFRVGEKLSKDHHGRLFFAGEHTQVDFFGYMEGALRSGERAAETLMLSACDLPMEPEPTSPSPPILTRATPARKTTALKREIGVRLEERLSTDNTEEVESPFLNEELFVGEPEEELNPRVAMLATESPFLQFNVKDFETEIIDKDDRALGADTFKISTRWEPYEYDLPPTPSTDITKALDNKDWTLALKLAIQEGWRDENDMTNLIFFARHPELPKTSLDPKGPNFKKLRDEWTKILNDEVWKAIEASAENIDLVVSGKEVADHHRRFFVGKSGKRLKKLVEDAATDVDLNPGLLGTIMMAETRRPQSYLSSEKASSYHIGADDFYEGRAAIKARVPAYAKVKWDKSQKPSEHLNDAKKPRLVKTILFDSGPDAVLATAVYLKFREVRLREIAADSGEDFDSLPLATRFALTRMAMAAGTAGATPYLNDALKGKDIFVREAIPVRAYQTKRNATVRTAQAMHLSDWVFGIPAPAAAASQPELEESEGWNEEQSGYSDVYSEHESGYSDVYSDHEGEIDGDSESPGFEDSYVAGDRDNYEGNFDLERLDISECQVGPVEEELVEEEPVEEELDAPRVREEALVNSMMIEPQGTAEEEARGTASSVVEPFPRRIVMPLEMITVKHDPFGACIEDASKPPDVRGMCGAVIDLTDDPDLPPYRGQHDTDMLYVGSLAKIYPLLAAFELRRRVTWQAKDMIKIGLSTTTAGWQRKVFAELKKGWQPRLDAAFRGRGLPSGFPKLAEVVELSPDGTAQLREEFLDWIRAALRHNDEAAAGRYIRALSYPYINGVLAAAGFFDSAKKKGLWISGDYNGNDWLPKDAAGMPLTARWRLPGHAVSNFTGAALQVARFLGLMAQGKLVDRASSAKMIELLGVPFLMKTLEDATPPRAFTSVEGKVGIGEWDTRFHDGAIVRIERGSAGTPIKYALAALGSPRNDISALRKLELAYHDCVVARHP